MAIHRALGATGTRLVHRGLAEAAILAAVGGALGSVLATGLGTLAVRLSPTLPRPVSPGIDGSIVVFAVAVTAVTALLFGVVPAVQGGREGGAVPGREAGRSASLGPGGQRLRRSLVVAELALTSALLVGSALLLRSFQRLGAVELGFATEGVVGVELHGAAWGGLQAPAAQAQWDEVLAALRAVPGVEAAGAIDYVPLGGSYSCDGIQRTDEPPPQPGRGRCAEVRVILPGALEAMRIPLLRGRNIQASDGPDAPAVAVIDQRMAEEFWPGEDPIGATFQVHTRVHEVVGIAADMRHFGPAGAQRPMVYLHAPQEGWNGIARGLTVVVRGSGPDAMGPSIRRAVAEVNGSIALGDAQSFDGLLRDTLAAPRFRTLLMVAFGVTAVLLTVLGIAGVMSYSVTRRTKEIGVRLALGADPGEVLVLVLREGGRLVAVGVALGLVGAALIADRLNGLLFEVTARDPTIYLAVAAALALMALAACFLPARRASRVDPVAALTAE